MIAIWTVALSLLASVEGCVFNNVTNTCFSDGIATSGDIVPASELVNSRIRHVGTYECQPDSSGRCPADYNYTIPSNNVTITRPRRQAFRDISGGSISYVVLRSESEIFYGEVNATSGYVRVGSEGGTIERSFAVQTSISYTGLFTLPNLQKIIRVTKKQLDVGIHISHEESTTITISKSMHLDPLSEGRLVYRRKMMRIRGRLRRYIDYMWPMSPDVSERDFEVVTQVMSTSGVPDNTYFIEYRGTNEYLHPMFYNILHKDIHSYDAINIWDVKSARQCGDLTIKHDKKLAVYRPEYMGCWIKDVVCSQGRTYTNTSYLLGTYDVYHFDREDTMSVDVYNRWKRHGECNIIHIGDNGRFWCKVYPHQENAVIMFRYT
jgi:hypothetical protein